MIHEGSADLLHIASNPFGNQVLNSHPGSAGMCHTRTELAKVHTLGMGSNHMADSTTSSLIKGWRCLLRKCTMHNRIYIAHLAFFE